MPPDTLAALVMLATAAAFTPRPNNALVASSGATFGLRRSLPHVLGIGLGFPVMIFLVGSFLAELFQTSALLQAVLRWGGAAVLLWMAWKIGTSGSVASHRNVPRPFTFFEAAAFQWINPKAWIFAVAITAQFVSPEAPRATAAIVGAVFVVLGLASAGTWAALGQALSRQLGSEARLRWFNRAMGALIAGCVVIPFLA